jgi:hypothetical protein
MLAVPWLIHERRLPAALILRVLIGAGTVAWVIVSWNRQGSAKLGGDIPCVTSVLLLLSCALASMWKRDRGLWMLYAFLGLVTLGGYIALELSRSGMIPMGPAPQATSRDIARLVRDAGLGAWVCFLTTRLLASIAVLNYRRFKPADPFPR